MHVLLSDDRDYRNCCVDESNKCDEGFENNLDDPATSIEQDEDRFAPATGLVVQPITGTDRVFLTFDPPVICAPFCDVPVVGILVRLHLGSGADLDVADTRLLELNRDLYPTGVPYCGADLDPPAFPCCSRGPICDGFVCPFE